MASMLASKDSKTSLGSTVKKIYEEPETEPLGANNEAEAADAAGSLILFESLIDARQKLEVEGGGCTGSGKSKKYLVVKVFVLPSCVAVVNAATASPNQDVLSTAIDSVLNDTHALDITDTLQTVPNKADSKVEVRNGARSLYLKFHCESHAKDFLKAVTTDQDSTNLAIADPSCKGWIKSVERAMWASFGDRDGLRRFYFNAVLRRDGACQRMFLELQKTLRAMLGQKRLYDCQPETMVHVVHRILLSPTLFLLMTVFNINLEDYRTWARLGKGCSSEDLLKCFVDKFEDLVDKNGLKVICALYQFPASLTGSRDSGLWLESPEFAAWCANTLPAMRMDRLDVSEAPLQYAALSGTASGIHGLLCKFLNQGKSKEVAAAFPSLPVSMIKSDPFPTVESVGGGPAVELAHFSHILFHSELQPGNRDQIEEFLKQGDSLLTDTFLKELIKVGLQRDPPRTVKIVHNIVFKPDGSISDDIAYFGKILSILATSIIAMLIRPAARGMGPHHELNVESPVCVRELFDILLRFESLWSTDPTRYNTLSRHVEGLKQLMKADANNFKADTKAVYRHGQLAIYIHLRDRIREVSLLFPDRGSPQEDVNKNNVIDIITGFFIFALETRNVGKVDHATDILCHFLMHTSDVFFSSIFHSNGRLRARVCELLVQYYRVRPRFNVPIVSGQIMNTPDHFQEYPLRAMAMVTPNMDHVHASFAVATVISALTKLNEVDKLDDKLKSIEADSGKDTVKAFQLHQIMQEVSKPSRSQVELKDITLTTLDECSLHGTMALNVLRSSPSGQEKLAQLLQSYLSSFPPTSWCSLFSGASTIAFFIKYLDRENLEKANEQFCKCNVGNQFFLQLFGHVKQQYLAPLVRANDLSVTDPSAMDNVITKLIADSKSARKQPDEKFLCQVFAEWMKRTKETVKVAMVPRNTQVLTFLTFVRIFNTVGPSTKRAFLAQVGTGEGKSLIIAIIALYQAKLKGKKVHVLSNNIGLLQRDYESFRAFYDAFEVTSAANNLDSGCSIVYCQRDSIEQYYRAKVQANQSPFVNSVLIVDEVDQLIVDEFPYTSYVTANTEATNFICACFTVLKTSGDSAAAPTDHPDFDQQIWNDAKRAYEISKTKVMGVGVKRGYQLYDGKYRMNDDATGELLENTTALWLEYINFTRLPDHRPVYQCCFFVQCMVFMLQQYEQIIGLSGALGSPVERVYLDKIYKASCFVVPPFLSTCNNVVKEPPVLIDDCAYIHDSVRLQEQATSTMAIALSKNVPVLIIMETDEDVQRLFGALNAKAPGKVQKLLKVDDGQYMPWTTIVRDATLPLSEASGYRITITNYWGGRGHDYVASDERVSCHCLFAANHV